MLGEYFCACLPFGKKLPVMQKAEAEKEATNCVASDGESCRHVYKALAQLSVDPSPDVS
jgi:hypothetical protein